MANKTSLNHSKYYCNTIDAVVHEGGREYLNNKIINICIKQLLRAECCSQFSNMLLYPFTPMSVRKLQCVCVCALLSKLVFVAPVWLYSPPSISTVPYIAWTYGVYDVVGIAHKLPFLLSLQLHLNSFHLSIHFTAQPFCCILPGCRSWAGCRVQGRRGKGGKRGAWGSPTLINWHVETARTTGKAINLFVFVFHLCVIVFQRNLFPRDFSVRQELPIISPSSATRPALSSYPQLTELQSSALLLAQGSLSAQFSSAQLS